ncbi:MAG: metal-dependent hydrolase [Candidatus Woesearchaeota archaeon]
MKGITHILMGISIYLFLMVFIDLFKSYLFFFLFMLGVLFPDIDETHSILGKKFKLIGWIFNHRGFFHSIFSLILFSSIFIIFNFYAGLFFALGYSSHIIEDMLTKKGIKPFMFGLNINGPIKVGSPSEFIISLIFLILVIILIVFWSLKIFF